MAFVEESINVGMLNNVYQNIMLLPKHQAKAFIICSKYDYFMRTFNNFPAMTLPNQTPHSYQSPSFLSPPADMTGCFSSSNLHCPAQVQSAGY